MHADTPERARVLFQFTLHSDATGPLEKTITLVESALRCTFMQKDFSGEHAWQAEVFGLRLVLQHAGYGPTVVLHGRSDERALFQLPDGQIPPRIFVDLSQGMADLLNARLTGVWRIPSPTELHELWEDANPDDDEDEDDE